MEQREGGGTWQLLISRLWILMKYELAQDRKAWRAVCKDGLESLADMQRYGTGVANLLRSNRAGNYPCQCGRFFRRQEDLTRHFCDYAGAAVS